MRNLLSSKQQLGLLLEVFARFLSLFVHRNRDGKAPRLGGLGSFTQHLQMAKTTATSTLPVTSCCIPIGLALAAALGTLFRRCPERRAHVLTCSGPNEVVSQGHEVLLVVRRFVPSPMGRIASMQTKDLTIRWQLHLLPWLGNPQHHTTRSDQIWFASTTRKLPSSQKER